GLQHQFKSLPTKRALNGLGNLHKLFVSPVFVFQARVRPRLPDFTMEVQSRASYCLSAVGALDHTPPARERFATMSDSFDETPAPLNPGPRAHLSWARATMWMVIALVVVGGTVLIFRACVQMPGETISKTGDAVQKVGSLLKDVASAFRQGTITTSFTSYATTIEGMQLLQVGKVNQMEIFTRTDERTLGYLTLPEVIVEARAPIEYTYYVDLNGPWRFVVENQVLHAYPPDIGVNTPAVDVSKMSFEVRKGRFGTEQVQEDLKRSISYMAKEKARQNIGLIRETARGKIGEFVANWLARSFPDGKEYPVKVYFPKEAQAPPHSLLVRTNSP
ncbi:MAG TPA: hypothetical protein VK633_08710, partial [Verrucomicrobiae bacterium]|nr:hypothetical protein [Verrucomicrobiae bacterium]